MLGLYFVIISSCFINPGLSVPVGIKHSLTGMSGSKVVVRSVSVGSFAAYASASAYMSQSANQPKSPVVAIAMADHVPARFSSVVRPQHPPQIALPKRCLCPQIRHVKIWVDCISKILRMVILSVGGRFSTCRCKVKKGNEGN